jgi:hypothetical protein
VIVKHDVVWKMTYAREGDEFGAHLDPIHFVNEEWGVMTDPGPKIVQPLKTTFR